MLLRTGSVSAALLWALSAAGCAHAQDSDRSDWLRNPAMGNYKAYAEFKMAHYDFAREVWQTLAEVGNGDALFNLGVLAEDGLGEPKSMDKALALYASAASADNFKAQYRLGLLFFAGKLVPHDAVKARRYLTQAAAHGDKDAQAMLASLGQTGEARAPLQEADWLSGSGEHEKAATLYRELADKGDATAQTRLAWAYEAGRGVAMDLSQAAHWFGLAARAGDADAQYAMAVMLRTGRGLPMDAAQSTRWLEKAAAQKHPAASAALTSSKAQGN